MSKLSRNQIVGIVILGVVLIVGALIILSSGTEEEEPLTTDEPTAIAEVATEVPTEEPTPTTAATSARRDVDLAESTPDPQPPPVEDPPQQLPPPDSDGDGVPDDVDACNGAPDLGFGFDSTGCPIQPPDSDNDGIIDPNDNCPNEGDLGFGLQNDGCPILDTDGDGVGDNVDVCPEQGDQGLGLKDDGCPILDTDNDGVVDDDDACVDQGDQGFGVQDDGCPVLDTDGDGVFDADDLCPDEGDLGNGVDADGCPIPVEEAPVEEEPVDTDGDGVFDADDLCPEEGDLGNGVDADGCPIPVEEAPLVDPNEVDPETNVEAPSLAISANDQGAGVFQFDVTSEVPDGAVVSWDFGDGSAGVSGASVSHDYGFPAQESQEFTVTATLSGDGFDNVTASQTVTVTQASFPSLSNVQFQIDIDGLNVVLTDQSSNEVSYTRAWDLGETTAGDQATVNYTYTTPGTYTVSLTLTDEFGRTYNASQEITVEPAVEVTASCQPALTQLNETLPIEVEFSIASAENIGQYEWDFGSGDVVTQETFTRSYAEAVTVSGTVRCIPLAELGLDTIEQPFSITIEETEIDLGFITVDFSFAPGSGPAPLTTQITNNTVSTLDGETLTYEWVISLRDGNESFTSQDENPSFTLPTVGIWDLSVTVTGDTAGIDGTRTATGTGEIEVIPAEEEINPDFTLTRVQEISQGEFIVTVEDNTPAEDRALITQWNWTVTDGDGNTITTTTGPGPHTFNFSEEGRYIFIMEVSNDDNTIGGRVEKSATSLTGGTVTASFVVESKTTLEDGAGFQVCFRNTSQNYDEAYWFFDFINAPDASSLNNDAVVCTVYPDPNRYNVKLETVALDENGNVEADAEYAIFINAATGGEPPIANYSSSTTNIQPGGTVNLNNTSTGNVLNWTWQLFDSNGNVVAEFVDTNYDASFTIQEPGTYSVRLEVSNGFGSSVKDDVQIVVTFPEFECVIRGDRTVVPGQSVTYRADLRNVSGRETASARWELRDANGNVVDSGEGTSYQKTWTAEEAGAGYTLVFFGELDDSATCEVERSISVDIPPLECTIDGNNILAPNEQTTFTISVPRDVERYYENLTFDWNITGDFEIVNGSLDSDTVTVAWPDGGEFSVGGTINASNAESAAVCVVNFEVINVGYQGLDCDSPDGRGNVDPGDIVTYDVDVDTGNGSDVRNVDGRDYTVEWQVIDRDTEEVLLTGSGDSFQIEFTEEEFAGRNLRIQYRVIIDGNEECVDGRNVNVSSGALVCGSQISGLGGMSPAFPNNGYEFRYNGFDAGTTDATVIWTIGGIEVFNGQMNGDRVNVNASAWASLGTSENVEVVVVVINDGEEVCRGTGNVTVGQLNVDFNVDRSEIGIGEQICVTNTSRTAHDDLDAVLGEITWAWDFDRQDVGENVPETSDQYQPGCITYNEVGEYRIRLEGTFGSGASSDMTGNRTRTIRVVAEDALSVTANPQEAEGGSSIDFTATPTNVDISTLEWSIDGIGVFNREGTTNVSYTFPEVEEITEYTVRVSGQGEVRQVEASVVVTIFPLGGLLSADFIADNYGVPAGAQVCLTDQSTSQGPEIVEWVWDFGNGDGVTFTVDNYQATVCTTYDEPGQSYLPRLTVTNSEGLSLSASNTIKTYTDFENRSSFFPTYQGGTKVCFTPVLDEGVSVTGWNFGGAGTEGPGEGGAAVCYTYDTTGTYIVTMNIQSGQLSGSIPRSITVTGGQGEQPPDIFGSAECVTGTSDVRLFVQNNGGDMVSDATVSATFSGGDSATLEGTTPFRLLQGGNATFFVRDVSEEVTFTVLYEGSQVVTTTAGPCEVGPTVNVSGVCRQSDATAIFTINASNDFNATGSVNYTINGQSGSQSFDQFGTPIEVADFGDDVTITLTDITIGSISGATATVDLRDDCWDKSSITVAGECVDDTTPTFFITNGQGSEAMAGGTTWTLYGNPQGNNNGDELTSGTTRALGSGETETIVVPAGFLEDYDSFRLVADQRPGHPGTGRARAEVVDCGGAPELSIVGECSADNEATFTVTNAGGDMTEPASVVVSADLGEPVVDPTELFLSGETTSQAFVVTGGYGTVTLSVADFELSRSVECDLPSVSPVLECVAQTGDGYIAHFGYNNTSGEVVEIPVGPNNRFNPDPQDRGQPTAFEAGRSAFFPDSAVQIPFDGNTLVWSLAGRTATASANSNPCGFHILFDKEWVIGENPTDAPSVPEGFQITASGSFGSTATCTWTGAELACEYSNPPNVVDPRGLLVAPGASYTVTETNLPEGWTTQTGTGTFTQGDGFAQCGAGGLDKFCTHTVVNETAPEYVPDAYCNEGNGTFTFEVNEISPAPEAPTYRIYETGNESNVLQTGTVDELPVTLESNLDSLTIAIDSPFFETVTERADECYEPPAIQPNAVCGDANGTFVVSIERLTQDDPIGETSISYIVYAEDDSNNPLESGTISISDLPYQQSFSDLQVNSVTIEITDSDNVVVTQSGATKDACYQAPELTLNGICADNGVFNFGANLSGGEALEEITYTITEENGDFSQSGPISELENGITITGRYNTLTLSADGEEVSATPKTLDCYTESNINVDVYCADEGANGEYVVSMDASNLLPNDTISLVVFGDGEQIFMDENATSGFEQSFSPYGTVSVTAMIDGTEISDSAESDQCYTAPQFTTSAECVSETNGSFSVTADSVGEGTPIFGDGTIDYVVVDSDNNELEAGTLTFDQLPYTYTAENSTADWVEIQISNPSEGSIIANRATARAENCYTPPTVDISGECADNAEFTFGASLSGDPLGSFSYVATDQDDNEVGSGSLDDLINGITINGKHDSVTVTVSSDGGDTFEETAFTVSSCYTAPDLNVNVICAEDGNGFFRVDASNDGGSFILEDSAQLTITANNGTETLYDEPFTEDFSQTFGEYTDVSATLTFNGDEIVVTDTSDECYDPPTYTPSGVCESNGIFVFDVTTGGGEPITESVPQAVVSATNLHTGETIELFNGNYTDLPVQFTGPYSLVTMTLTTDEGEITVDAPIELDCYTAPQVTAAGTCLSNDGQNGVFGFDINLNGSFVEGTPAIPYVVEDQSGNEIASGEFTDETDYDSNLTFTGEYEALVLFIGEGEARAEAARTGDCFEDPNYVPAVVCADANGIFNLSINNTGGAIVTTQPSYQIFLDGEGQGIQPLPDGILSTSVEGRYETVALEVYTGEGNELFASADNSECYTPPVYEANVICEEGNGSFRVTADNVGGDLVQSTPQIVVTTVDAITGESNDQAFTQLPFNQVFDGPYSSVTVEVSSTDVEPVTVTNEDCYTEPVYTPVGECVDNGQFQFSISRTGDPVTNDAVTYTLTGVQGDAVELITVDEPVVLDTPILVEGRYDSVTIELSAPGEGQTDEALTLDTCYNPPVYVPNVICEGNGEYRVTIDNEGGEPVGELPTVTIETSVINGGGIAIDVRENVTLPFDEVISGPFSAVSVSINSPGVPGASATGEGCYQLPNYQPELVCVEGSNGTFQYGFSNTGAAPLNDTPQPEWFLRDDVSGEIIASGQGAPFTDVITGEYEALTFGVETGQLFYGAIEAPEEVRFATTTNADCYVAPEFVIEGLCYESNGAFGFTVDNTGGPSLNGLPSYTVTADGEEIDSGQITGFPFERVYTGDYDEVTFSLDDGGEITTETLEACYSEPQYGADAICYGQDGFFFINIFNNGEEPLPDAQLPTYELVSGEEVLLSGDVTALPFTETFTGAFENATLRVTLADGTVLEDAVDNCFSTDQPTPEPTPEVPPEGEEVCGAVTFDEEGYPIVDMDPANCDQQPEGELVDWTPLGVGEAICPDWLAYHTDQTGDWEIFRLGELPNGLEGDLNLSQGEEAIDLAPSRAPDGLWIAFASTRDGDWEIFVARADDPQGTLRQITLNESAIDLDPVWSPDGMKLAYETTVDGNFEIRMIDLETGAKYRLTDNPANDINPFWAPDGQSIVFQSDRFISEEGERLWQLHTIDLSDGFDNPMVERIDNQPLDDNHDPQYSSDGEIIAFRSYVDDPEDDQSAIYLRIELEDGTFEYRRISELGGDARHASISPNSELVAYQSNLAEGINDIYVYEIETDQTRLITENMGERYEGVQDTSPTWYCESTTLVFTSNVETPATTEDTVSARNDNNIYLTEALPIDADPIETDNEGTRLTFEDANDRDPQNTPPEENASRNGALPPKLPLDVDTTQ